MKYIKLFENVADIKNLKEGDYVKINPKSSVSTHYKNIISVHGMSQDILDRIDKININTVFKVKYSADNRITSGYANMLITPVEDINLFFNMKVKDLIPAEQYEIDAIKYNL